jgi:hypothetical protein
MTLMGTETTMFECTAFGLRVQATWELPGATAVRRAQQVDRPTTLIRETTADRLDAIWARAGTRVYQRPPSGDQAHFTIDRGQDGYRMWFNDFGRYAVSLDGTEISCDREAVTLGRCERFLFAQALPLASILHGLDLLHASAICGEAGVAAFVGTTGAGKTTFAARLVARGATLVADDALALELRDDIALAHPGPAFAAVASADPALRDGLLVRMGPKVGESDKVHVSPAVSERTLPLKVIYYLDRNSEFELTELSSGIAERLLANGFAPYVVTPDRLLRHFELVHAVSESVAHVALKMPWIGLPDDTLAAVETHMRTMGV